MKTVPPGISRELDLCDMFEAIEALNDAGITVMWWSPSDEPDYNSVASAIDQIEPGDHMYLKESGDTKIIAIGQVRDFNLAIATLPQ